MKRSVLVVAAIMIVSYIAVIVIVEASEAYRINYGSNRLDIQGYRFTPIDYDAEAKGHIFIHYVSYASLDELVNSSKVIIVGRVVDVM